MKNILVTGSSGLIGTILLKKIKKYNLFGIDIKENNYKKTIVEKIEISLAKKNNFGHIVK